MRMTLTLAAAAAAACGVILAPADMAFADNSAQATIDELESQGYMVNVDRVGSGPLDSCQVTSVRNANTIYQWIRVNQRPSLLVPYITSRTVQVSLYCAG
jgi:hypothetical protein